MSDSKNVFTEMKGHFEGHDQKEGADYFNPEEFAKLVHARRSVRQFTSEKIPDHIVNACLDLALLAPNSSNLQSWEFYRITSSVTKEKVIHACFSQPAAKTAAELIVCVGRRDMWRKHSKQMLELLKKNPSTPASVLKYYSTLVPFVYTVGYFSILAPFKWLFNTMAGIFSVVPRDPISNAGLNTWAAKSCALACENIMLAFRSYGYDTCPMEGFDAWKVRSAIGLTCNAEITMIISAGKRADGGVYGPRIRFPREQFIKEI